MKVEYIDNFVRNSRIYPALVDELEWERRGNTPRMEYYSNKIGVPYSYGRGRGIREYLPKPWHPYMLEIEQNLASYIGSRFEVCFLNRYEDQTDHLGWHADDSPEMDDNRPIAIISFGVPREIWFRPNGSSDIEKVLLRDSSLCIMPAGMQDTHQHRIPKSGSTCGRRISLTFRGYVA